MREIEQFGVILRTTPWKDADALLTVLTAELGRITVSARGIRQSNRRYAGGCDLLDCGRFIVNRQPSSGYYRLIRLDDRRAWSALRENLDAFLVASYCVELALLFAPDGDPDSGAMLRPLYRTLQALEREEHPDVRLLLGVFFHLTLLRMNGLNILDHPTRIHLSDLKTWFGAMSDQETPIRPHDRMLILEGLHVLHAYTREELGTELRCYSPLAASFRRDLAVDSDPGRSA